MNAGRVFRIGKLPVNALVGAYYNVVTPQYGADWQLRTQVTASLRLVVAGGAQTVANTPRTGQSGRPYGGR